MTLELVLGGPGCGKTEHLLRRVETALELGVPPERIAYVAFTNRAADEARDRATARFGLAADAFPHFRTLHSLCFRELGLRREDVMGPADYEHLSEYLGEPMSAASDEAGDGPIAAGALVGDRLRAIVDLSRARRAPVEDVADAVDDRGELRFRRVEAFAEGLKRYKEREVRVDFADMLDRYVAEGAPVAVDLAIVDEAQDLTTVQWDLVRRAFGGADEVLVAGDDDQAIYAWAGADVGQFLGLRRGGLGEHAAREVTTLATSHRLPRRVHRYAAAIARRIGHRYEKRFTARGGASPEGDVRWLASPEEVDLAEGTWLLLARHVHQLAGLQDLARRQSVVYETRGRGSVPARHVRAIRAWEDLRAGKRVAGADAVLALDAAGLTETARGLDEAATYGAGNLLPAGVEPVIWHDAFKRWPVVEREYYLACLRRGERLLHPRVRVETVHGAKGAEADRVLLLTDVSARTERAFRREPDAEHRVFYVGVSRAREELLLVAPRTPRSYDLPVHAW